MYQQTDPPLSPRKILPTMYDLPSEEVEDSGLLDQYHLWQGNLLGETFSPPDYPPDRVFSASDLNLYYDLRHSHWYKRPDWFAVLGEVSLSATKFWLPEIRLGLGLWSGEYQGLNRLWLRWYDQNGCWLPTLAEKEQLLVEREKQRAEREKQRAEQAEMENAKLRELLRQSGIEIPNL